MIVDHCVNHLRKNWLAFSCLIFRYACIVNSKFAIIIVIQFAVSMLVVCSNLYRMAMAANYMSYIPLIVYTSAILVQIFIYCWFGNEVKLKVIRTYVSHDLYFVRIDISLLMFQKRLEVNRFTCCNMLLPLRRVFTWWMMFIIWTGQALASAVKRLFCLWWNARWFPSSFTAHI